MARVETQAEADHLNTTGEYGPYSAVNGHRMMAELRFPRDDEGIEREFRIGDEIRYDSWSAWCCAECDHSELGPLPDW